MFYALAIALCLAVLFIVLAAASVLCLPAVTLFRHRAGAIAPAHSANLLFAIRMLPLALASLVTVGFVLPAFVEFEPVTTGENMSLRLAALAMAGALVLIIMLFRGLRILRATRLAQNQWLANSELLHLPGTPFPIYRVAGRASLLAVTGFLRPRVFIAKEILEALSIEELSAALAHEMAHVKSFDNLRRLLLGITRLPERLTIVRGVDAAWTQASEVAADQAALTAGFSALDLSSALVKVGRLSRPALPMGPLAASHLLPCGSSLEARVMHLQELLEEGGGNLLRPARRGRMSTRILLFVSLAVVGYAIAVPAVLPVIHDILEFLVR
jgi:Zn-dependent protease with chaperone function